MLSSEICRSRDPLGCWSKFTQLVPSQILANSVLFYDPSSLLESWHAQTKSGHRSLTKNFGHKWLSCSCELQKNLTSSPAFLLVLYFRNVYYLLIRIKVPRRMKTLLFCLSGLDSDHCTCIHFLYYFSFVGVSVQ